MKYFARRGVGRSPRPIRQIPIPHESARRVLLSTGGWIYAGAYMNGTVRIVLIVLLVLIVLGSLPTWGYSSDWGYGPSGGAGLLLVIFLVLLLLGKI